MANTNLTDTQRVILAAAAARESGLVLPTPKTLTANSGTLGIVLKSLINRKLVTERPILPDEPVWREDQERHRTTLVISSEGLEAIGIEPEGGSERDGVASADAEGKPASMPVVGQSELGKAARGLPKAGSKLNALITSLRSPDGATIVDLTQATGWQSHSVRGTISGNLKKKLKLQVTSVMVEGRGRVYRLVEVAAE